MRSMILVAACLLAPAGRAAPASQPAAPPALLGLFVGNNRSLSDQRPDLRYADDDAFKYAELFSGLTAVEDVEVVTRADEDSRELYGDWVDRANPPTYDEVLAAAQRLATRAQAARASGLEPELFFAFAGHGDQRDGQGFLELEDRRLGRAELIEIIAAAGVARAHVVLDSCNSFFVVHPRRPGGKVWASAADVVGHLEVPGVDVGVFLSTSAEAQVYEWSQLQSGVFSHAVRSGLSGAADADGDGAVSYGELDAFVSTATQSIKNPLYRPYLYVQAPASGERMLDLGAAERVTLASFSGRCTLRDARGLRLADVNPEAGFAPALVLQAARPLTLSAELAGEGGRRQLWEAEVAAARLEPGDLREGAAARSGSALFAQLFALPFGPAAVAAHRRAGQEEPPRVYGLTQAQLDRFTTQLRLLAEQSARQRAAGLTLLAVLGGVGAAAGLALVSIDLIDGTTARRIDQTHAIPMSSAAGVGMLIGSTAALPAMISLLPPVAEEAIYERYLTDRRDKSTQRAAVARALEDVHSIAEERRDQREDKAWAFGLMGAAMAVAGTAMAGGHYGLKWIMGVPDPELPEMDSVTPMLEVLGVVGVLVASSGIAMMIVAPFADGGGYSTAELIETLVQEDPEPVSP